jgi:hypothetical protein
MIVNWGSLSNSVSNFATYQSGQFPRWFLIFLIVVPQACLRCLRLFATLSCIFKSIRMLPAVFRIAYPLDLTTFCVMTFGCRLDRLADFAYWFSNLWNWFEINMGLKLFQRFNDGNLKSESHKYFILFNWVQCNIYAFSNYLNMFLAPAWAWAGINSRKTVPSEVCAPQVSTKH